MKRLMILTVVTVFVLFTSIAFSDCLDSYVSKEGDIIALVPPKTSIEYIFAIIRCPDRIPCYHFEWVDEDGDYSCTSAPPKGCNHCIKIWNRIDPEEWSRVIVKRRKIPFTKDELDEARIRKVASCSYDRIGLQLQWLDFGLSCSRWSNFRALWQWDAYEHCLSYALKVAGFENHHIATPWDLLESNEWETIVDCEL